MKDQLKEKEKRIAELEKCVEINENAKNDSVKNEHNILDNGIRNKVSENSNLFLIESLKALWQLTSNQNLAPIILTGSPEFLILCCNFLQLFTEEKVEFNVQIISFLSCIIGILLNFSANSMIRLEILKNKTFLQTLMKLLNDKRIINSISNNQNVQDWNSIKELIISLFSNLAQDTHGAFILIDSGFLKTIASFLIFESTDSLRRYSVSITRMVMDGIIWGKTHQINQINIQNVQKEIGFLITQITVDPKLRLFGMEILSDLQRTIGLEE